MHRYAGLKRAADARRRCLEHQENRRLRSARAEAALTALPDADKEELLLRELQGWTADVELVVYLPPPRWGDRRADPEDWLGDGRKLYDLWELNSDYGFAGVECPDDESGCPWRWSVCFFGAGDEVEPRGDAARGDGRRSRGVVPRTERQESAMIDIEAPDIRYPSWRRHLLAATVGERRPPRPTPEKTETMDDEDWLAEHRRLQPALHRLPSPEEWTFRQLQGPVKRISRRPVYCYGDGQDWIGTVAPWGTTSNILGWFWNVDYGYIQKARARKDLHLPGYQCGLEDSCDEAMNRAVGCDLRRGRCIASMTDTHNCRRQPPRQPRNVRRCC